MTIVLFTLFAIALTITFTGLLLSPRPQMPSSRKMSYATRDEGNMRRSYVARQVRTRRPGGVYGRRGGLVSWTGVVALNVRGILGPGVKTNRWLATLFILTILFAMFMLTMRTLLPGSGVTQALFDNSAPPPAAPAANTDSASQLLANMVGASKDLIRVGQMDANQYGSPQEYSTWAASACSATSMTEVINSYGHHYRITDILSVESHLNEISPELGLLEPTGIDHTVAQFGFKTVPLDKTDLDGVIAVANHGHPVIVGFPPNRWAGGHILVVRGGGKDSVYLADSSQFNMTVLPRAKFLKYWGGFAVVPVPNNN